MMIPIKHAANFFNGAAFKPSDWGDTGLPILRIAQLTGKPFDNYFSGEINRQLEIRDGDLLFSWSATIDAFMWDRGDAILNQHIFKVVPKRNALKGYLYYVIKAHAPRWADDDAHGSTMRHIKKGSLSNKIWLPDLNSQQVITDFLDREIGLINQLIEKKNRQISLLNDKIERTAEQMVTGEHQIGVPKMASGIPWMPSMPAHWEVCRAKDLFKEMARPPADDDGVITAFRDGQVTLRTNRRTNGFTFAVLETGYQHINKGDLVIHSMDAFAGAIGVSEDDGKATGEYVVCTARSREVNNEYYALLLRCMAKRNYVLVLCPSVRERAPRFRYVRLAPTPLPVPPRDEQDRIVDAVRREVDDSRHLRSLALKSLELLKESRFALITAAVTGQIDVTTWGKQGQTDRRLDKIQEEMGA